MAKIVETAISKEELVKWVDKYTGWIDGTTKHMEYAKEELEHSTNPFEINRAEDVLFKGDRSIKGWKWELELFKLALAQLEEQEKCCGNCEHWYDLALSDWGRCSKRNQGVNQKDFCRLGWQERTVK